MFFVYVLLSKKDRNIYIGQTENIEKRLKCPNSGKVTSTKYRRPLELLYFEKFETRKEALINEKKFKKGYKREEIKSMLLEKTNGGCSSTG